MTYASCEKASFAPGFRFQKKQARFCFGVFIGARRRFSHALARSLVHDVVQSHRLCHRLSQIWKALSGSRPTHVRDRVGIHQFCDRLDSLKGDLQLAAVKMKHRLKA